MRRAAMRWALCAALLWACGLQQAHAAYSCSASATPLNGIYDATSILQLSGTLTIVCTRAPSDANTYAYAVSLDNGITTGLRRLYRHGGNSTALSEQLRHRISRITFGGTNWAGGANAVTGTLNFGASTSATANHTYYMRLNSGQTGKTAGIYDEILTFSLRQGPANGPVVATTTLTPTISIISSCFVGNLGAGNFAAPGTAAPSALVLNYTSFAAAPVSSTMTFTLDCTMGTPYTLALSPASGTLLGLPYSLSLNVSSGTGTGLAQAHQVTGTIPAGLSGVCAGPSCTATQPTTITISY